MADLVYRLRNPIGQNGSDFNSVYWIGITKEAADRIEALEAALREITMCWNYEQCAELARAALAGEKKDE